MNAFATPANLALGIASGLAAAAFMSFSYLLSRHHGLAQPVGRRESAAERLLVQSHLLMGIACVPALAAIWPDRMPPVRDVVPALAASAGFYLVGQMIMFHLLRRLEASRLTPFLGLKIFILAAIVAAVLGQSLTGRQWLAVVLSVSATALLQKTSGGLPARAFGLMLAACLCFALADLCIVRLIDLLATGCGLDRLRAGGLAMLINYFVCGGICGLVIVAAPLTPLTSLRATEPVAADWSAAGRYAVTWLVSMTLLYTCFAITGAVFGNVIQSTRGMMSIVIGAALAHLGWHELEQRVEREALLRRLGAAVLMTVAIAVYAMK